MTDHERKMQMFAQSVLNLLARGEVWDPEALFDKIVDNALDLGVAEWSEGEFKVVEG